MVASCVASACAQGVGPAGNTFDASVTFGEPTDTASASGPGSTDGETMGDTDDGSDPDADGSGDDADTQTGDPTSATGDTSGEASCSDGILNQDESDVDCGGSCPPCEVGQSCIDPLDCTTMACADGSCVVPSCVTDDDCTALDADCVVGVCGADYVCATEASNEGGPCDDGDACTVGSTCGSGACGGGSPVDCSSLTDDCNVGVCDPVQGCVAQAANEGASCTGADQCASYSCAAGACTMGAAIGFFEDFSDNTAGWTLGTEWQIGSAVAGCGDPSTDHTPTADNGVAGVVLGGCAATVPHDDYCLTSPIIDSSAWPSASLGYWRHLWSDYTPFMQNRIDVWNGATWNNIFLTGGSPGVDDKAWTWFQYDISAYRNAQMQVRWCFNIGSTGVFSRGSWNIDDVEIAPTPCVAP